MALQPGGRALERIMCFGAEGCGKSIGALDVARAVDSTIWVVDNDNAWDRMLENQEWAGVGVKQEATFKGGEWQWDDTFTQEHGRVVLLHVDGWVGNIAALEHVAEHCARQDWLVIDSATALWSDVQDWYTEEVFNEGVADYFLSVRLEKQRARESGDNKKTLGAFEGFMDWPVINAQYKKHVGSVLVNPPCHLYITCEQAEMAKEEDRETRGLYAELGVKPKGQKRTGHNVQTVLWLTRKRGGVYRATTVKDRGGREEVEDHDVTDVGFADWYLRQIAGWVEGGARAEKPVAKKIAKKG